MLAGWNIRIEGTDLCAEVVRARPGRPLSPHRDQPRPARPLRGPLLRPRGRGLDGQAGGPQAVQLPPGQPVRAHAALQPRRRPLRRHLPAQRHALLLAGDAARPCWPAFTACWRPTASSSSAPANSPPTPRSGPRSWPEAPATSGRGCRVSKSSFWPLAMIPLFFGVPDLSPAPEISRRRI